MTTLTADLLIEGCGDLSEDAGLTMSARLEPIAGDGSPVKPPIYAGGSNEPPTYQAVHRWHGAGESRRPVHGIVIDNVPSQANRVEHQLQRAVEDLSLPELSLSLSSLQPLPAHVPEVLSSFQFPHRSADAYLRDSLLDGEPLPTTEIGQAILRATPDDPTALLQWFPHALVLGFWQSHLGKKGQSQAKLARSWTSEIVGLRPAYLGDEDTFFTPRASGVKGDQLNLSTDEDITKDPDDGTNWNFGSKKEGTATKKDKLSEIGHGQVPFSADKGSPAPVSFATIEQRSTLSLSGLRRIWAGEAEANALTRAVAAATILHGHALAHGRPFSLRSGCDLRPRTTTWTWLGASGDDELELVTTDVTRALFDEVVGRAADAGLPVGGDHWRRVTLEPNPQLARAIRSTYPIAD